MLESVANRPSAGSLALSSKPCTAAAPSSPNNPRSCVTISPRAASAPKKKPATAMTMMSTGAIEKSV
jgi:hypothetical protein